MGGARTPGAAPAPPSSPPDIVLVEADHLDEIAIQRIRGVRARYANARVLVVTSFDVGKLLCEALDAGASGFLFESSSEADLMSAIQTVACGGLFVPHELLSAWLHRETSFASKGNTDGERLTPREIQVLRLIVAGYTNPAIATRLCISVRTVEFHRKNIREKLHARSRVELMRYALGHGLLADAESALN